MKIGGLLKFSIIDYPKKMSAVIFTQGCNFRCPYCHNSELVLPERFNPLIPEKEIFEFLEKRQGKLEAVSITGGEPTLHKDLPEFLKKIKDLGFLTKIDTNGTNPLMIKQLIDEKLIDYIAMDIKAPLEKYDIIADVKVDEEQIKQSVDFIIHSGVDHEFRTTVVKSQLVQEDIVQIVKLITGAKKYKIQKFVARDSALHEAYTISENENSFEKEIKLLQEEFEF